MYVESKSAKFRGKMSFILSNNEGIPDQLFSKAAKRWR